MASFATVPALQTRTFNNWLTLFKDDDAITEWKNGYDIMSHESLHSGDIHFAEVCVVCKRGKLIETQLIQCNHCHVVNYCCQDHLISDYKNHKRFCVYASKFYEEMKDDDIKCRQDYENYLSKGLLQITESSQQDDNINNKSVFEYMFDYRDCWLFQKHCCVCFSRKAKLISCDICYSQHVCDQENCHERFSAVHTSRHCELHLINYCTEVTIRCHQGYRLVAVSNTPQPFYLKPIFQLPNNWHDYLHLKINDFPLPAGYLLQPPTLALLSEGLTEPLTILKSLEMVYTKEVLIEKSKIVIHILNVQLSQLESCLEKYEEMLHWLPCCSELVVVHIGHQPSYADQDNLLQGVTCNLCKCLGRHVRIEGHFSGKRYEQLFADGDLLERPTLVYCPHSGVGATRYRRDQAQAKTTAWTSTLSMLKDWTDVPCVFTASCQNEMDADVRILTRLGMNILHGPTRNQYHGLRPRPEPLKEGEFYYINQELLITKGNKLRN